MKKTKEDLKKPPPARKPTPSQVEKYIEGGSGRDTEMQDSVSTVTKTYLKPGASRLTVDLPRSLHRRFKIACTIAEIKMNDEIRQLIDRRCAELETSADAARRN